MIISALAAEGASIAPRHIDDVVRKGAALFAPMYKKKPEKRAATAGTGGTPDVKRGKAPEAERLTRRSVSALPPAPPVTKAGPRLLRRQLLLLRPRPLRRRLLLSQPPLRRLPRPRQSSPLLQTRLTNSLT